MPEQSIERLPEELVSKTLDLFNLCEEEVYSIPVGSSYRYGPELYLAYDIGSAAIDAIYDLGYEKTRPLSILRMVRWLEEEAKRRDPTWEQTTAKREITAWALNNYSPGGPFSRN